MPGLRQAGETYEKAKENAKAKEGLAGQIQALTESLELFERLKNEQTEDRKEEEIIRRERLCVEELEKRRQSQLTDVKKITIKKELYLYAKLA